MRYIQQDHNKIKLFAFFALAILIPPAIGMSLESKSGILSKASTFQAETGISYLRSPVLKPQTASPVALPEGILVFSSRKIVKVIDLSGNIVKEFKTKFAPAATPAVDHGKLFVGGKDGKFHCLDLGTGEELWVNELKSIDFSAPAVFNDLVIFQTAGDRIIALDTTTGKWRWEYQHLRGEDLAVAGMCPPLVVDDTVYLGLSAGFVMAMDAASGRPLWKSRPFTGSHFIDVDSPMVADEENLFAISVGGGTAALSRKTGKVVWKVAAGGLGGLRLAEGKLFVSTEEPAVMAFEALTGKQLWSTKLREKRIRYSDYPHRPVVVKGVVATVTRGGKMFALDAADGKVLESELSFTRTADAPVELADGSGFLTMDNKGLVRVWKVLGE